MKKAALVFAAIAFSAVAKDEPKTNYVGDGRYSCSGNNRACALIEQGNRQRESERANDYQREQDRAQAIIDRERRDEAIRRYGR